MQGRFPPPGSSTRPLRRTITTSRTAALGIIVLTSPALHPRIEQEDEEGHLSHLILGQLRRHCKVWFLQGRREQKKAANLPQRLLKATCSLVLFSPILQLRKFDFK